ncbi:DegV family protein with EDD domain [Mobilisporobacter senegalensis]|uniref:DegV family protein with EDD domain n=1 Tax=Mobilisporobacter senegalensis TaxID=1329262 RepID=A0A3N1XTH5_9FIRM|nr:DegV family protein [Mobilisporobacter senegalensis]ROR28167.1 DegV family protein with EDD domain [Mobilisporobacter senegalensis]
MRDFVITTDSNSDLPEEYITENQIGIIPHYYDLDGITYGDEINLTPKQFYDKMREGKMPTTMASNPAVILDTFRKYAGDGLDILHLSFSAALSGGCSNVMAGGREVAEEYKESNIIVIDTCNVSLCQGMIVMKAVELKKAGKSIEEVAQWIRDHLQNFCVQFTVDDLFHLNRGGRISKTTAIMGTVINVKPILYVNEEGALLPLSKVRGRKRALSTIVDNMEERMGAFKDNIELICIVHGDSMEDARYVEELIKSRFQPKNIIINTISPSIGAHSGPGAIGICFMGERK